MSNQAEHSDQTEHGMAGFVAGCSCRVCYQWAYRRGYRADNPTDEWLAKLESEMQAMEADMTRILKLGTDDRGVSLIVVDPLFKINHPLFLRVKAGQNRVNRYALNWHEDGTSSYVFLGSTDMP